MFVKIIYWSAEFGFEDSTDRSMKQRKFLKSKELQSEIIYECKSVQFCEDSRELSEGTKEIGDPNTEKIMCIHLDEGINKTIEIPMESKIQMFEVFLMNEDGKTIDRYIY